MPTRQATHAGSWYSSSRSELSSQLDAWLSQAQPGAKHTGPQSSITAPAQQLPVPGARVIIAPHAGYAYSGPAAAWAYKALDLSKAKRVFLLGPSHHFHLTKCALSQCDAYKTPFGDLAVDTATIAELHKSGLFDRMAESVDEEEHSLEMHLPYIYKMLSLTFPSPSGFPPLIPILVGSTSASTERRFGALLAPYLADPSSVFIVSSDFCHWGTRFRYTYYEPPSSAPVSLKNGDRAPSDPPIHESIKAVDFRCMGACESGRHAEWLDMLERTGNTVCGRHPIGVVMAAMETLRDEEGEQGNGKFRFVRYERSSEVRTVGESSVSYASAFAVL
ncbi:MEMO1 family [Cryomyces antarcticus]